MTPSNSVTSADLAERARAVRRGRGRAGFLAAGAAGRRLRFRRRFVRRRPSGLLRASRLHAELLHARADRLELLGVDQALIEEQLAEGLGGFRRLRGAEEPPDTRLVDDAILDRDLAEDDVFLRGHGGSVRSP